jgi:secondary thiamine-phosphate synthase enzyme
MTVRTSSISISTHGNADIHDITNELAAKIDESGLRSGTITVFCPSATSAVTTIEFESGALRDLQAVFDEIVPPDREYAHNARWGDGNGHSHVRAALLGPSLTIPFVEGRLILGTWQQVIHVDFDNRPRRRELVIQIMGE